MSTSPRAAPRCSAFPGRSTRPTGTTARSPPRSWLCAAMGSRPTTSGSASWGAGAPRRPSPAARPRSTATSSDHLASAGVAEYVEFPEDELPYREYCRRVRTSRAVLPLVDDFAPATRRYLAGKCSSATTQAVAWQRPLVVNGRYADSLGLEAGYRYRIDDLASGIRTALDSSTDVEQQASLAQFRDARLAASARAFTEWVHP